MINNKPEVTWDKICQQVGKTRIDINPKTRFGIQLKKTEPEEDVVLALHDGVEWLGVSKDKSNVD